MFNWTYDAPSHYLSVNKLSLSSGKVRRPLCDSSTTDAFLGNQTEYPYIIHKKLKYIWNFESENFELLQYWDKRPYNEVLNASALTTDLIETRRSLYGINMIDIILTPIIRLVLNGCLTPFHCFQVFICVIWYCVEYEIYATCIAVFSVISLIFQVYELHKNERALKRTVCISSKVGVFRCYEGEDDFMLVDSTELVPGDLIAIPSSGCLMQCDAVLLVGNCIVDESSLTGESLPITKIPLPNGQSENTTFDFHSCPRHILFSGTSVIQTRGDINKRVLAVVIRTGFMTTKGELVRSIMFPKPMKFKFTRDVYQFLGALCGVALVGLCVTIYLMFTLNLRGYVTQDCITYSNVVTLKYIPTSSVIPFHPLNHKDLILLNITHTIFVMFCVTYRRGVQKPCSLVLGNRQLDRYLFHSFHSLHSQWNSDQILF